jgi:hypothetical protein
MHEYSVTNEKSEWLTGNIQKGCFEWTNNKEKRYTMEFNRACYWAEKYDGILLRE